MIKTEVPLGDGTQLRDLLEDDEDRIIELTRGPIAGLTYDYACPPILMTGGAVQAYKRVIGHGARLWCNNSGGGYWLRYEGRSNGADKRKFFIDDLDVNTNAQTCLHALNMNFAVTRELTLKSSAGTALLHENLGNSGYSEFNRHEGMRLKDSIAGVRFERGSGNASFHGTVMRDMIVSKCDSPIRLEDRSNVYNSFFEGSIFADSNDPNTTGIVACGTCHGTTFDIHFENPLNLGIRIDSVDAGNRQHQCKLRFQFIHPVNYAAEMFHDGDDRLPEYVFTYGVEDRPQVADWLYTAA